MEKKHMQAIDLLGRVKCLQLVNGEQLRFKAMTFDGGAFAGFDDEQALIIIGKDDIRGVIKNGERIPFTA